MMWCASPVSEHGGWEGSRCLRHTCPRPPWGAGGARRECGGRARDRGGPFARVAPTLAFPRLRSTLPAAGSAAREWGRARCVGSAPRSRRRTPSLRCIAAPDGVGRAEGVLVPCPSFAGLPGGSLCAAGPPPRRERDSPLPSLVATPVPRQKLSWVRVSALPSPRHSCPRWVSRRAGTLTLAGRGRGERGLRARSAPGAGSVQHPPPPPPHARGRGVTRAGSTQRPPCFPPPPPPPDFAAHGLYLCIAPRPPPKCRGRV